MTSNTFLVCLLVGLATIASAEELSTEAYPCDTEAGEELGCWTCLNAADDADCMATGEFRTCHQDDPVCELDIHQNENGEVNQVTRKCKQRIACDVRHANGSGICGKLVHNRLCRECGFGEPNVIHKCLAPPAEPYPCSPESGSEAAARFGCWTCMVKPTEEACQAEGEMKLCHMHDPVCEFNFHQNDNGDVTQITRKCKERMACEVRAANGSGICGKLNNNRICRECTYGEPITVDAPDHGDCMTPTENPCDPENAGERLSCWTCHNEPSDEACLDNGQFRVCHMSDPVCELNTHDNWNGDVHQVTRMCKQRRACEVRRDSRSGICYKLQHNQICRSCGSGAVDSEYQTCEVPASEPNPCLDMPDTGVWCWGCSPSDSEEECMTGGDWEYCTQQDPICQYRESMNPQGKMMIKRGCVRNSTCSHGNMDSICSYGEDGIHSKCAPPPEATTSSGGDGTTAGSGDGTTAGPGSGSGGGGDGSTTVSSGGGPTTGGGGPGPGHGLCPEGYSLECLSCSNEDTDETCLGSDSWERCSNDDRFTCGHHIHINVHPQKGNVEQHSRMCKNENACSQLMQNHGLCEGSNFPVDENDHCWDCSNLLVEDVHYRCIPTTTTTIPPPTAPPPLEGPCDGAGGETLACWACNDDSDAECRANGHFEICNFFDPVCQFDVSYDECGAESSVVRGCAERAECEENAAGFGRNCSDYGTEGENYRCIPPSDGSNPCVDDEGNEQPLACWTCINAGSDDECYKEGQFKTCKMSDPVCEHQTHFNNHGDVKQITRRCKQREACEVRAADTAEVCTKNPHNTICRECSYGYEFIDVVCVPDAGEPPAEENPCDPCVGEVLACWACSGAADDDACFAGGNFEACRMSDPVCSYSAGEGGVSRGCAARASCEASDAQCSYGFSGIDYLCMSDGGDVGGDNPCVSGDTGSSKLSCWTCHNSASEGACQEEGEFKVCHMEDPMCLHEVHRNTHGDVTQITRMCKQREACQNLQADQGEVCTKHAHNTLCRTCGFGDEGEAVCVDTGDACPTE